MQREEWEESRGGWRERERREEREKGEGTEEGGEGEVEGRGGEGAKVARTGTEIFLIVAITLKHKLQPCFSATYRPLKKQVVMSRSRLSQAMKTSTEYVCIIDISCGHI